MCVHCLMNPREGLPSPREGAALPALRNSPETGNTYHPAFASLSATSGLWGSAPASPALASVGVLTQWRTAAAALSGGHNFCAKSLEPVSHTACNRENCGESAFRGPSICLDAHLPVNSACLRVTVLACVLTTPWFSATMAVSLPSVQIGSLSLQCQSYPQLRT